MTVVPHHRYTISGVFGSTTQPIEIWSCHLATRNNPTVTTPAQYQSLAVAVNNAWLSNLAPLFASTTVVTNTRVADVGADGRVTRSNSGGYNQADAPTSIPGSGAAAAGGPKPLQTALVASLMTARAGSAGKGRMFLPWPETLALASDYRLTGAQATSVATACKGFLNAVAAATNSGPFVVVGASSTISGKSATLSDVTAVRVGRAPDTMRSRRGALLEGYSVVSL